MDSIPLERVWQTNHRSFRYGGMTDQSALDLSRPQAVATHFEDIIHAADDPDIAVFVYPGGVSGLVHSSQISPILVL